MEGDSQIDRQFEIVIYYVATPYTNVSLYSPF